MPEISADAPWEAPWHQATLSLHQAGHMAAEMCANVQLYEECYREGWTVSSDSGLSTARYLYFPARVGIVLPLTC